ncbi:hypothetical protein L209DRAFT_744833 [Thermothelomyces heterothallicus CBS 203.75]
MPNLLVGATVLTVSGEMEQPVLYLKDSLGLLTGLPYVSVIEEVANGGISSRGGEGEIEKSGPVLDLEDQAKIVLNGVKDRANLVTTTAKSVVSAYVDLKFCRDLLELVLVNFALLIKRHNVEIRRALAKNLGLYYYGCLDLDFRNHYIVDLAVSIPAGITINLPRATDVYWPA